jgi:hypothetical protein
VLPHERAREVAGAAATIGAIRNSGGIAQRMLPASVALTLVVGAGFAILLPEDRVEALGGWITVHSQPAAGTSLELPFRGSVGASRSS